MPTLAKTIIEGPCARALMEALGIDPADFDEAKMLLVGPAEAAS